MCRALRLVQHAGEDSSLDSPVVDSELGSLDEESDSELDAFDKLEAGETTPENHSASTAFDVDKTVW